ncbi:MAG TPA: zinc ribbon domain-containing protein [Solirubrobacteraceae bacterium]|nr:zinc ribbon domain-containing protein [Solirubrobacteraceae bacterium]
MPIQSQLPESGEAKCPSCGAAIVADQRYCLTCGQPCSPARLPFLDVLQAESDARAQQTTVLPAPVGYLPATQPDGAIGWLRRYSGLLALVGVLLVTGLIGLLIGHWTKSSVPSGPQIVKIEGAGLPLAAAGSSTSATTTPSSSTSSSASKQAPASEAQEKKEVKETEASTVKAPPPVKTSSAGLKKLSKTTGKTHQKEIESLTAGGKPIETGG